MIDFHTHILPSIDDGADTLETSVTMLHTLQEQGVNTVVLTPHYYSHHKPIEEFVVKRNASLSILTNALREDTPKICVGAEVYFTDYLFNNHDLTPLCIQGTRTMLVELPYNKTITAAYVDKIDRLITEYNITPVLAHVERYPSLIRSTSMLERFIDIGCVLQTNVSSYTEFGKRRLISLVNKGYIGALGTDAHNLDSRPPQYTEGYSRLKKSVSEDVLHRIQRNMKDLLKI